MSNPTSQDRRSFLKSFASALAVVGVASAPGASAVTGPGIAAEAVPMAGARADDDVSLPTDDHDMADPGWSY